MRTSDNCRLMTGGRWRSILRYSRCFRKQIARFSRPSKVLTNASIETVAGSYKSGSSGGEWFAQWTPRSPARNSLFRKGIWVCIQADVAAGGVRSC
jgi:hypothetical protein